jgi:hypothetical protein
VRTLEERLYRAGPDGPSEPFETDRERYVAEGTDDASPWLVMAPDGEVREYRDRQSALRAIRRRAQKAVRPGAVLITEIEWRFL